MKPLLPFPLAAITPAATITTSIVDAPLLLLAAS
jgi:hypothetical protein